MAFGLRLPSSASKEGSRNLLSRPHELRVKLDCDPPRLLPDWDATLTVRRPKPLIPLTTAPHRVNARSSSSFPATTIIRAAMMMPSASTGAVSAITASETSSFVVNALMRSLFNTFSLFRDALFASRMKHLFNKRRAIKGKPGNAKQKPLSSRLTLVAFVAWR